MDVRVEGQQVAEVLTTGIKPGSVIVPGYGTAPQAIRACATRDEMSFDTLHSYRAVRDRTIDAFHVVGAEPCSQNALRIQCVIQATVFPR